MWFDSASVLRVGLAADHIVVAKGRHRGPGNPAVGSVQAWSAAHGGSPWNEALQALSKEMTGQLKGARRVEVVLSNRLVRWQLLAVPPQLVSLPERQVFAQSHFASVYGKRAENWLCTSSSPSHQTAVPACAVESALIFSLQAVCAEHGVELRSVVPYWSHAVDHWQSQIREDVYWLAQAEPDMLTLGLVHKNAWLGLRSIRTGGDLVGSLGSLQTQMLLALDGQVQGITGAIPVYAMGNHNALETHQSTQFRVLQPRHSAFTTTPQWRLAWGI